MPRSVRYRQSTSGLGIASNGTTAVTLLTFGTPLVGPDGTAGPGGIIDAIRVHNSDSISHIVELHLVPNADAAGDDTLMERVIVPADTVYRFLGPERAPALSFVQVKLGEAHSATPVYCKIDVSEIF
jgi:hypothetical protein